jgi:uncharacterized membrane-anchored protein
MKQKDSVFGGFCPEYVYQPSSLDKALFSGGVMPMAHRLVKGLSFLFFCAIITPVFAEVQYQSGPATVDIGDLASLDVPAGYRFAPKDQCKAFMEMTGNSPTDKELGVLVSGTEGTPEYFAIFEFDEIGYIKDAASEKLDPAALLNSVRQATEAANAERKNNGWAALEVVGWDKEPFYNPETQRLEWSIKGREVGGSEIINYHTRILGRKGVMSVVVVVGPQNSATMVADVSDKLKTFAYKEGNKYAQWLPGDRVAEIGLAALILGGVGAVALKTGLLAKFWKFILLIIAKLGKVFILVLAKAGKALFLVLAAVGAAIKQAFTGKSSEPTAKEGKPGKPAYTPQGTSSPVMGASDQPDKPAPERRSEAIPHMDDDPPK